VSWAPGVGDGRAWQPVPIPPPARSRAVPGGTWGSPSGCGPVGGPGSVGAMAGHGRAVGSWRLTLLWHRWAGAEPSAGLSS